ncbi:MAG: putative membrane protein SpoIIM required for sporulation [Flavobacteriales bacterium]|jgi:uncharacterized membrane protein SpoIIM required for sporulation
MKQQDFERQYTSFWDTFNATLEAKARDADLRTLPDDYQKISHHLALAKQRRYSTSLIQKLNNLVVLGHKRFYGDLPRSRAQFLYYIFIGFPEAIQRNKIFILTGLAVFFLPGLLFFFLCWFNEDLIYSLMSFEQVRAFESMYEPSAETFGRERESDTDLMMFCFYIYNNIGISFQTFATGIFYCVGSLFFLIYNGIYLGAAAGHIMKVGYTDTFFPFVIGHGAFELTAIALCGGAGLKLGWALIAPGNYTRFSALKIAAKDAVIIIYGSTVMLIIAAFLEAFWSSSSNLPNVIKYSVGALFWFLVYYYLLFAGRRYYAT